MKFTDGYWLMRPGYRPYYATQVQEVEAGPDSLTVYAATRPIQGRGDTLDTPLLTLRYSSPLESVIKVETWHHMGGPAPRPEFELQAVAPPVVRVQLEPDQASLRSEDLSVVIQRGPDWRVEFRGAGQPLTHSGWRALGFVDTPQGRYLHEQLGLGVGELVYGLGERFTPFVKNGQVVELWNADGGTSSEQAYKNIPFYLTNRGYGVFVAHPERVSFEVASEKVERVQFSLPGEYLCYYLVYGPTPKQILARYTALTGRPALPPAWSFGLWLSTSFTTDYDEASVSAMLDGMAERDLPVSVFHFDCFWMKAFHWSNFEWDPDVFPDPAGMLARLKERGLKICLWINPYIAQRSRLFAEGLAHGYLLKRPDGSVWQSDQWQSGLAIVDFSNPGACDWYAAQLQQLLQLGVDSFKTDFGERIPTEVVYHDGSDPQRMHNYYSYLYNRTVFELLEQERGRGQAVVFARSATTGGQQFPVHWGGDNSATFESLAESLRGGLSLGLGGFGFWSHDIGGFEQTAPPAVYKRWCAFGLLSSHSRLHGNTSYRVPWNFDAEAVEVLRHFTHLKHRLMPYLYQAALQAHQQGLPLLRAMLLEFPHDPGCEYLDRQYMLGDSLLVAPVMSFDGQVQYYLPAGRWTHLLSGEVLQGPGWRTEQHDFFSLPLLVRPGTVLPMGARVDRPDYNYAADLTLQVYEFQDGDRQLVEIPGLDGSVVGRFEVEQQDGRLLVQAGGAVDGWQVVLVNIHQVARVQGGRAEDSPPGMRVRPLAGVARLEIVRSEA